MKYIFTKIVLFKGEGTSSKNQWIEKNWALKKSNFLSLFHYSIWISEKKKHWLQNWWIINTAFVLLKINILQMQYLLLF